MASTWARKLALSRVNSVPALDCSWWRSGSGSLRRVKSLIRRISPSRTTSVISFGSRAWPFMAYRTGKSDLNCDATSSPVYVDDGFGPTGDFVNTTAPIPDRYERDAGVVLDTCRESTCRPVTPYDAAGNPPAPPPRPASPPSSIPPLDLPLIFPD